ncbi:MAG: alpha/beta hydrolase [Candidatus Palauibacterales bacterium]|nr:alpha/beta hydrolase [Candidatus Palauibacterales bacterium]
MPSEPIPTDVSLLDATGAESLRRSVNGVRLHAVAAGEEASPLVVLLHGFPEFWYGWHAYVEPLVEAGFRVLAPDQRGYNLSEKPDRVRDYRLATLTDDIRSLISSEGRDSAFVVGHDWGGVVAWDLALRHPDAVDGLVALNAPHPVVFRKTLTSSLRQLRRSWYMFLFQLPRVPEWLGSRNDFAWLGAMLRRSSREGAFSEEDLERYRAAWRREGAPTGMLNWYRAMFRHPDAPPRRPVEAPTLVLWGDDDMALLPELATRSVDRCEDGRLVRFPDATHWIQHERPDEVTDLILEHLGSR